MAAQRIGSILTNVTGTAGQVLKVKSTEDGFEFVTPATIPEYTITNKTIDRVMNADDVTLDELADVVGTLIDDLAAAGISEADGLSVFQWSTSEQVWPFEKGLSGETLYAKYVNFGALPNAGSKTVAHSVSNLKVFKFDMFSYYPAGSFNDTYEPIPTVNLTALSSGVSSQVNNINVIINTGTNRSSQSAHVYLIYSKTA